MARFAEFRLAEYVGRQTERGIEMVWQESRMFVTINLDLIAYVRRHPTCKEVSVITLYEAEFEVWEDYNDVVRSLKRGS